jgi:hypothetical protein
MPLNTKSITIGGLVAAAANGIATSQSGSSISINGSLASGGVASLSQARRVIVTSQGDDTGITFSIVGTDRYGRAQTEVLKGTSGPSTPAQTAHDFLTVTSITPSGAVASSVTAGTNGTASSDAYIVDWVPNGNLIGINAIASGSVTYSVEECYDDFSPAWDQANNTWNWVQDATIKSTSASAHGQLAGPFTAIRITVNSYSGTSASVTAKLITPFIGGRI